MECATPSTPDHGSHVSSAPAEHDHEGPDCPAAMACNSAMVETVLEPAVAPAKAPSAVHPSPTEIAAAAPVLTAEPPPPRRLA
jgi:hypothetical protein